MTEFDNDRDAEYAGEADNYFELMEREAEAAERQADAMETLTLNTERIAASLETIAKCVHPSKNGVPALSINEEYLEWRSNL